MAGQRIWHESRLVRALAEGAMVVTASERLARAVQLAYAQTRSRAGDLVWEQPRVLSWQAFLAEMYRACQDAALLTESTPKLPDLLSPGQTQLVWEKVIRASDPAETLLQPAAAAKAAQDAWLLCHAYRLKLSDLAGSGALDTEQFLGWAANYQHRCHNAGWLDAARLPDLLAEWSLSRRIAVPSAMVFAGFDEWTPQQEHLLQCLRDAGCHVEVPGMDGDLPPVNARRLSCNDSDAELEAAARWAGALLSRDANSRIAIVVRDLGSCRERLARSLDQVLCQPACTSGTETRPYNLSLGRALIEWPVIQDALLLLRTAQGRVDFSAASQLLRSPFLRGADSERAARSRFELDLRDGPEQMSLTRLAALAHERAGVPELSIALNDCLGWKSGQSHTQLPSSWAGGFAALLQRAGWPGERTRDSIEYQTVDAFQEALGTLAKLDAFLGAIDLGEALQQLAQILRQRVFQPQAADVPIQVLGLFEMAGLQFDHLWIIGLSDDVWPASPRPDPLIPVRLQRQHDMPHASANRELAYARRITSRLLASAPEVIASAPLRDADQDLRASPLLAQLPETTLAELPQHTVPDYADMLQAHAPTLDKLDDAQGSRLNAAAAGGGTGILKAQSACPFQAYARYRLGAEPMNVPEPGLSAAERGSLLHDVMYRLWGELAAHSTLLAQSADVLQTLIERQVRAALGAAGANQPDVFTPRFIEIEHQRITRLVSEWLEIERARLPFAVVQRELKQQIEIGPLQLNTRVDRIDRLADGSHAIIDYKSGDARPAAWNSERPDEPQLPCYAVSSAEDVGAVLFGILRPGETGYRGYTRADDIIPGLPAFERIRNPPDGCGDWKALFDHWRQALDGLATAFAAGHAAVAPKDRNRTCSYCHLATLCRIDETQQAGDSDDE